jgi:hypothetical protein
LEDPNADGPANNESSDNWPWSKGFVIANLGDFAVKVPIQAG